MARVVSVSADGADVARGALEECVAAGGVVVFPADGLYGLACDPLDAAAIARIHAIKGRDEGKPSAIMYFSPLLMRELVPSMGPRTREAAAALLPGPLTLVIANPEHRYPLACREDPERLGVRLIEGPLSGARTPIFQTSANRSGQPPPAAFGDVDPALLAESDLAIDAGELAGRPSTVVDLTSLDATGRWAVLREGAIPVADIARVLDRLGARSTLG
jgi:L-threonylcarbamoyladenylate synthase